MLSFHALPASRWTQLVVHCTVLRVVVRSLYTSSGCREAVTPAYFKLVQAMFATLERVAASDPKHGDRLRLESYAYFVRALDPLASQVNLLV